MRFVAVLLISLSTLNPPKSGLGKMIAPISPRIPPYQPISPSKSFSVRQINPIIPNDPSPNYPIGATNDNVMRQIMGQPQRAMGAITPETAARKSAQRVRQYKKLMNELRGDERNTCSAMHNRISGRNEIIDYRGAKVNFDSTLRQFKIVLISKQPSHVKAILENRGCRNPIRQYHRFFRHFYKKMAGAEHL